jgi:hypothetical protein
MSLVQGVFFAIGVTAIALFLTVLVLIALKLLEK